MIYSDYGLGWGAVVLGKGWSPKLGFFGRPPLLHQGGRGPRSCGTRSSATSSCRVPRSRASTTTASSSTTRSEAAQRARGSASASALIVLSYLRWHFPYPAGERLRAVGDEPVRPAAVRDLLQDLHGEGVGHPVLEICAEWAAQRIKGLSLAQRRPEHVRQQAADQRIKTLIDEFDYPRLGPGMMWERVPRSIERWAARVLPRRTVVAIDGPPQRRVTASTSGTAARRATVVRGRPLHLEHADARAGRALDPRRRPRRPGRRPKAPLPRLPHGGLMVEGRRSSRQLDLHPRPRRQGRAHPELQELEPGHGAGPGARPASGSSTSASRATASGRCRTRS